MTPQKFRRLFDHHHPIQKYLEIFDDWSVIGIDSEFKNDGFARSVDPDRAARRRVIDPVVDVEISERFRLHAAALDVGFVGDDKRGRYRSGGVSTFLFMVADGVDNEGALVAGHSQATQDIEGDEAAALGVILAVDEVADVV